MIAPRLLFEVVCPHCFERQEKSACLTPGTFLHLSCKRCTQAFSLEAPPEFIPAGGIGDEVTVVSELHPLHGRRAKIAAFKHLHYRLDFGAEGLIWVPEHWVVLDGVDRNS